MVILGGASPVAADVFSFKSNDFRYLRVNNLPNAGFPTATPLNEFFGKRMEVLLFQNPSNLLLLGLGLAGPRASKRSMRKRL